MEVVVCPTRRIQREMHPPRLSRQQLSQEDLDKVAEIEDLIRDWFEEEQDTELDLLTNVEGITADVWTEGVRRACRAGWAVALRPGMVIIRDPDAVDA